jgi:hypothetical protein
MSFSDSRACRPYTRLRIPGIRSGDAGMHRLAHRHAHRTHRNGAHRHGHSVHRRMSVRKLRMELLHSCRFMKVQAARDPAVGCLFIACLYIRSGWEAHFDWSCTNSSQVSPLVNIFSVRGCVSVCLKAVTLNASIYFVFVFYLSVNACICVCIHVSLKGVRVFKEVWSLQGD